MSNDITFCASDCVNTECRRHKSRVLTKDRPHSFFDFHEDCTAYSRLAGKNKHPRSENDMKKP